MAAEETLAMCPGLPSGSDTANTRTDLLDGIKRRIGSEIEPPAFDILREAPSCLDDLLVALSPLIDSCRIQSAAEKLRDEADRMTRGEVHFRDHLDWLIHSGHSREDSRQIRYLVEAFYHLEPVFAIIAAVAHGWIMGSPRDRAARSADCRSVAVNFPGPFAFAAEGATVGVLGRVSSRRPPGLFLRGLAMWPGYARGVQIDLPAEARQACARSSTELCCRSLELAGPLAAATAPRSWRACPERGRALKECVRASCNAIPVICALRRGFIEDEMRQRADAVAHGR